MIAIAPLFILLLLVSSCETQKKPAEERAMPVTVVTVEPKTLPAVFEYVGVAASSHPVEIRARVEGYLEKIAYQEGEPVKAGDLLFQLDPRPFIASLDSAKGLLARYEAELWRAQQAVARFKPLYEQKAASKRDLDNAIADELSSQANVDSSKAQVVQAELNLSYTTIVSPISGVTNRSQYREGALITPGANSLLTTVWIVDPIWVYFSVSEGDLLKYRKEEAKKTLRFPKDMNFDIRLILSDGTVLKSIGKVNFADPSFHESTGTLLIRASFPNSKLLLRPGQFVRAQVLGAVWPSAISVPQQAVQQGQKGLYVFVVDKDDRAEMRSIVPGDWNGDNWIIKSGLNKGEQVVVDGVNKIQPGSKIAPSPYTPIKLPELTGPDDL